MYTSFNQFYQNKPNFYGIDNRNTVPTQQTTGYVNQPQGSIFGGAQMVPGFTAPMPSQGIDWFSNAMQAINRNNNSALNGGNGAGMVPGFIAPPQAPVPSAPTPAPANNWFDQAMQVWNNAGNRNNFDISSILTPGSQMQPFVPGFIAPVPQPIPGPVPGGLPGMQYDSLARELQAALNNPNLSPQARATIMQRLAALGQQAQKLAESYANAMYQDDTIDLPAPPPGYTPEIPQEFVIPAAPVPAGSVSRYEYEARMQYIQRKEVELAAQLQNPQLTDKQRAAINQQREALVQESRQLAQTYANTMYQDDSGMRLNDGAGMVPGFTAPPQAPVPPTVYIAPSLDPRRYPAPNPAPIPPEQMVPGFTAPPTPSQPLIDTKAIEAAIAKAAAEAKLAAETKAKTTLDNAQLRYWDLQRIVNDADESIGIAQMSKSRTAVDTVMKEIADATAALPAARQAVLDAQAKANSLGLNLKAYV